MNAYISILRGINVSGKNKIRMVELRSLYEKIGLKDVQADILSCNVVFSAKSTKPKYLEVQIAKEIQTAFGYEVSVIVQTLDVWKTTVHNNPFTRDIKKADKFLNALFLSNQLFINDQMVEIPAGKIELCDNRTKQNWSVRIKPFLLARFPVTQDLYSKITKENPSTFKGSNR